MRRLSGSAVAMLLLAAATAAYPEEVIEVWRTPFGLTRSIAVNTSDGSCWLATGNNVLHLSAEGTILAECRGFVHAWTVSVDPVDGSCWVADINQGRVVHLAENGEQLWENSSLGAPAAVAVNRVDGSCWVTTLGGSDCSAGHCVGASLVHLSAGGTVLWRGGSFTEPLELAVDPTDGSVWVADAGRRNDSTGTLEGSAVVHLSADGTELWRTSDLVRARSVSVNPLDGSCWVADSGVDSPHYLDSQVVHFSSGGEELWRGESFRWANGVSVDEQDGSCWVPDFADARTGVSRLTHLAADGSQLWRGGEYEACIALAANPMDGTCWIGGGQTSHVASNGEVLHDCEGFGRVWSVSVNPTDGSCWVADADRGRIAHLSRGHRQLWRGGDYTFPTDVAVSPVDNSCWVADYQGKQVVHLAEDGGELWKQTDWWNATSVAVNANDGSCWVAGSSQVQHFAADGAELLTVSGLFYSPSVAVNAQDGSCWFVADTEVVHIAADGAEIARVSGFDIPWAVAVNPTDGSCWVADWGRYDESARRYIGSVTHLSASGTELWRGWGFNAAKSVSVNPVDGSCWVGGSGHVVHLSSDGAELWRGYGFYTVQALSVDPTDGSCWVADSGDAQVVHLMIMFQDVSQDLWAHDEIAACMAAGIASGDEDGLYHPELPVTRDQMAVYVSRALAGGDEGVPDFTDVPTFPDVDAEHWALDCVEYAVDRNVVEGHEDGLYHPEYEVTRAQMAVFIARGMADPTGEEGLAGYVPPRSVSFRDVSRWYWAYRHIEYCVENGVVAGYLDGLYHPELVVTRDQMAVYVARAFGLTS